MYYVKTKFSFYYSSAQQCKVLVILDLIPENMWCMLPPSLWWMVRSAGSLHFQGCPLSRPPSASPAGCDSRTGTEGGASGEVQLPLAGLVIPGPPPCPPQVLPGAGSVLLHQAQGPGGLNPENSPHRDAVGRG